MKTIIIGIGEEEYILKDDISELIDELVYCGRGDDLLLNYKELKQRIKEK